jgi:Rhodopirellula transposase DDE domain
MVGAELVAQHGLGEPVYTHAVLDTGQAAAASRCRAVASSVACAARPLERLVDPDTRGDPESPRRWTTKSTANLADALTEAGHPVSPDTVGRLLKQSGYSLQGNAKTVEGKQHADRDAQFRYINEKVRQFQDNRDPVMAATWLSTAAGWQRCVCLMARQDEGQDRATAAGSPLRVVDGLGWRRLFARGNLIH